MAQSLFELLGYPQDLIEPGDAEAPDTSDEMASLRLPLSGCFYRPIGFCWQVRLDRLVGGEKLAAIGDSRDFPLRSPVGVLENGMPLGPAHAPHEMIRTSGGSASSHWGGHAVPFEFGQFVSNHERPAVQAVTGSKLPDTADAPAVARQSDAIVQAAAAVPGGRESGPFDSGPSPQTQGFASRQTLRWRSWVTVSSSTIALPFSCSRTVRAWDPRMRRIGISAREAVGAIRTGVTRFTCQRATTLTHEQMDASIMRTSPTTPTSRFLCDRYQTRH